MIASVRCRCGRRFRAAPSATGTVVCPTCDRISVVRNRISRRALWLAVTTVVTLVAVAMLAGYIAGDNARRKPAADTAARGEELATHNAAPPRTATPLADAKPVAPGERAVLDSMPERAPLPPLPREGHAPAELVPPRAGKLDPAPVRPAGRLEAGSTFGQEVVVSRRSAFRVAGVTLARNSEYAFESSFEVTGVNADGSLAVEQTVVNARLHAADPDVRAQLAAALQKTKGTKFEMTIGPTGVVTKFKGLKDPIRVLAGGEAGLGDTLRLWSLLDADAWRELAGLTFFQPDRPLDGGAGWDRAAAHDWGALGTWHGRTRYAAARNQPKKPGAVRVEYAHDIAHRPPAPGADRELPVRVLRAEFRTVVAGGAIAYDPATKRATGAEETFQVRGAVLVSVGGLEAAAEVEEIQGFKLTMSAVRVRDLRGPAPGPPK